MQVAAAHNLLENTRKTVEGRAKLGIEAFAQALLGIPKILAENSGYDAQETIIKLQVRRKSLGSSATTALTCLVTAAQSQSACCNEHSMQQQDACLFFG